MQLSHFFSAFNPRIFFVISLALSNFATIALTSTYDAAEPSVPAKPKLPLPVDLIYEFPPGIWCENLAIRSNGQILVTVTTAPVLYQVDPRKERAAILLYSFPATSLSGIVELEPDVFYVATGNSTLVNGQFAPIAGSFIVWKLDLRSFSDEQPAKVSKIAGFPNASLLNGVAVLSRRKGLLVLADSFLGVIWQLNVYTKEIKIFANDTLTQPLPGAPFPIGVNGIKVRKGAVYFSNTAREIIGRLIVKRNKTPVGPAAVVVTGLTGLDDFAIGANGAFFAAENLGDAFAYAPATGGAAETLANITANPTAVAFGRRPEDAQSAYITCAGGTFEEFSSSSPPRGKILKVDVKAFL